MPAVKHPPKCGRMSERYVLARRSRSATDVSTSLEDLRETEGNVAPRPRALAPAAPSAGCKNEGARVASGARRYNVHGIYRQAPRRAQNGNALCNSAKLCRGRKENCDFLNEVSLGLRASAPEASSCGILRCTRYSVKVDGSCRRRATRARSELLDEQVVLSHEIVIEETRSTTKISRGAGATTMNKCRKLLSGFEKLRGGARKALGDYVPRFITLITTCRD